jgi:hypothetical protein
MTTQSSILERAAEHLAGRPGLETYNPVHLATEEFKEGAHRVIDKLEQSLDCWLDSGRAMRVTMWNALSSSAPDPALVEPLSMLIDTADAVIGDVAQLRDRTRNEFRQNAKTRRLLPREARRAIEEVTRRMLSVCEKQLAEVSEFATFLRAMRAHVDPRSRGGPTFDDPKALKAYLQKALG